VNPGYAGIVSRAIGRVLDLVLLAVLIAGSVWLLQQGLGIDPGRCPQAREWWNLRARVCGLLPYAVPVAAVLVPPAYRILFLLVSGQTPGMAVMGLRLLRSDGRPVGLRHVVKRVLTFHLTLGLGSLLIPVTERRRALHDIVAGTVVVYDWGVRELEVQRAIEEVRSAGA
jgi:uncharacterized RDD family membrane protein YckC